MTLIDKTAKQTDPLTHLWIDNVPKRQMTFDYIWNKLCHWNEYKKIETQNIINGSNRLHITITRKSKL